MVFPTQSITQRTVLTEKVQKNAIHGTLTVQRLQKSTSKKNLTSSFRTTLFENFLEKSGFQALWQIVWGVH